MGMNIVMAVWKNADGIDNVLQVLVAQARVSRTHFDEYEWTHNEYYVRSFVRTSLSCHDEEALSTILADVRGIKTMCLNHADASDAVDSAYDNASDDVASASDDVGNVGDAVNNDSASELVRSDSRRRSRSRRSRAPSPQIKLETWSGEAITVDFEKKVQ